MQFFWFPKVSRLTLEGRLDMCAKNVFLWCCMVHYLTEIGTVRTYVHYEPSIRPNYEEDAWAEKYFKFLRQVKMQCSVVP